MSRENGRKRRQFSAEEKATILSRYLADEIPVSDLCDDLFYRIQSEPVLSLLAAASA